MNPAGRQGPREMLQTVQCNHAALVGTDVTTTVELTLALATPTRAHIQECITIIIIFFLKHICVRYTKG